jgi:uncharacterized membrane protein
MHGFAAWDEHEAAKALRESRKLVQAWCAHPIINKAICHEVNAMLSKK